MNNRETIPTRRDVFSPLCGRPRYFDGKNKEKNTIKKTLLPTINNLPPSRLHWILSSSTFYYGATRFPETEIKEMSALRVELGTRVFAHFPHSFVRAI